MCFLTDIKISNFISKCTAYALPFIIAWVYNVYEINYMYVKNLRSEHCNRSSSLKTQE